MSKTSTTGSASSNWLALKKTLPKTHGKKRKAEGSPAKDSDKRRKTDETLINPRVSRDASRNEDLDRIDQVHKKDVHIDNKAKLPEQKNGESIAGLRAMIAGKVELTEAQRQPGRYLAMDCEMVGVGIDGAESSLARVSLVNFYGAVQLDVFVRQRERVVDYRTEFSGIRPSNMVHAKPFEEVQQEVARLLEGRILIGHAVHNDTKALLLSHPRPDTRDTQYYAWKHKIVKSNRVALRNLVRDELGLIIQSGEHSSVTDARATMAVFRIYRKEWEKGQRPAKATKKANVANTSARKPLNNEGEEDSEVGEDENEQEMKQYPGGGRKGISSGLSVIVKRKSVSEVKSKRRQGSSTSTKSGWWKELD